MPIQKGVSKAFPSPKKHFKMASKWMQSFTVMESRANEERNKTQREFFDRPLTNPVRLPRKAGLIAPPKPMEVYHKITPVRSIQQSINLIKALKNEERELRMKSKPKSVAVFTGGISDDYGLIPNLRMPTLSEQKTIRSSKAMSATRKLRSSAIRLDSASNETDRATTSKTHKKNRRKLLLAKNSDFYQSLEMYGAHQTAQSNDAMVCLDQLPPESGSGSPRAEEMLTNDS